MIVRSELLAGALDSEYSWVRMGAALSLADAGKDSDVEKLISHWRKIRSSDDEFWIIAFGLMSIDRLPLEVVAKSLGFGSLEELQGKFRLEWDDWAEYWNTRLDRTSRVAYELLVQLRRRHMARLYTEQHPEEDPTTAPLDDLSAATARLRNEVFFLKWVYKGSRKEQDVTTRLEAILADFGSPEPKVCKRAIYSVLEIVFTDPERPVRTQLSYVLAALNDSEITEQLIRGMFGAPIYVPSFSQIRRMQEESSFSGATAKAPDPTLARQIAIAFACESLEKWTDPNVVWRIAEAAVRADPYTRVRAELILFAMDCERSLPALFWVAWSSALPEERDAAESILGKIIHGQLQYNTPLWSIRDRLFDVQLGWLSELLSQLKSLPGWSPAFASGQPFGWVADRSATQQILQEAIGAVALRQDEIRIDHFTSNSWDTFAGTTNRLLKNIRDFWNRKSKLVSRNYLVTCSAPKICPLEIRFPLQVKFDKPSADRQVDENGIVLKFASQKDFSVTVLVTSLGFQISPQYRQIEFHEDTETISCEFSLTAKVLGAQLVEINIIGARKPAVIPLTIEVKEKSSKISADDIAVVSHQLTSTERDDTRAIIEVTWKNNKGVEFSLWDAACPQSSFRPMGCSLEGISANEIKTLMKTHADRLTPYVTYTYKDEAELAVGCSVMSNLGMELFRQIVPQKLADEVKMWPAGSVVGILTNESWVPWELITHDSQLGLWGEHFVIMRLPRVPLDETLSDKLMKGQDKDPYPTDASSVASIVGDRIQVGAYSGWYSDSRTFPVGCRVTPLREPTLQQVLNVAPENDILHFTCHGDHDEQGSTFYLSLGADLLRRLLPEQVTAMRLKPGSIVFANACGSGQAALSFREFVSFGWKFFNLGAGIFVGTLGPVPDGPAFELAAKFYQYFLVEGMTAGQALRAAKDEVRRKLRNPFGVLYCLYGTASYRRRLPIQSE